jgi:hypothetical protein
MNAPKSHLRTADLERAEARLEEAIACLKLQFADVEAAVEDLKRRHQDLSSSPRPRRGRMNG